MLAVTVVVSGAVLLALEIIASRVLAPVFGNSIFVWGSLIGVVLTALAAGYAAGGWAADRWPSVEVLASIVFGAGLLVALLPVLVPSALASLSVAGFGPRVGPLAAALALFFFPAALMGMIAPYAIRLRAKGMATIGNVAGALYALSTLGSIAGGLLAAFVLLDVARVPVILSGLGAVLLALAGGSWLVRGRVARAGAAVVVAVLVVGAPVLWPDHLARETVRFERDSVYHRITVADEAGIRYLKLDNYWQSAVDLDDRRRTVFAYTDYLHLPMLFAPQARRVLMIGLGGGTVPTRYVADYPSVQVEVVELDPAVVDVARRYFAIPVGARLHVTAEDGRRFVTRASGRYEIILLDAYLIDTIPFHLATQEFFAAAKAHVAPGGVVASNVIGALAGPQSGLFRAIYRTVASIFRTVYVFPVDWGPVGNPDALRNIILVATSQPRLSPLAIGAAAAAFPGAMRPAMEQAARSLYDTPIPTGDVPVLTDDYAPVETLLQWR